MDPGLQAFLEDVLLGAVIVAAAAGDQQHLERFGGVRGRRWLNETGGEGESQEEQERATNLAGEGLVHSWNGAEMYRLVDGGSSRGIQAGAESFRRLGAG